MESPIPSSQDLLLEARGAGIHLRNSDSAGGGGGGEGRGGEEGREAACQ